MTTIAVDENGIMAADSMVTYSSDEGGTRYGSCSKIYRKTVTDPDTDKDYEVLIGTSGESSPSLIIVDWYPGIKYLIGSDWELPFEYPDVLLHLDGSCDLLILEPSGLYECDIYCRPEKLQSKFWAVGSGSKCALAAMECGLSAERAVEVASKFDPYTRLPIKTGKL